MFQADRDKWCLNIASPTKYNVGVTRETPEDKLRSGDTEEYVGVVSMVGCGACGDFC